MAAQTHSASDASSVPVPFSYAQAAKGISKPASGTATPAKDQQTSVSLANGAGIRNWAEDVETQQSTTTHKGIEQSSVEQEVLTNGVHATSKNTASQLPNGTSGISSPDFGAASTSTLGKDDDVSSIQNASSESTWENKSQTSTAAEKTKEKDDAAAEHPEGKKGKKEKAPPTILHEAPIPAVNIWKMRAEEAAKTRPTVPTSKPAPAGVAETRKKMDDGHPPSGPVKDRRSNGDHRRANQDEQGRRAESDVRKRPIGRAVGKDEKPLHNAPLPPTKDQESWPTPEIAQDEEKRRTVEKGDKTERDRSVAPAPRSHGKNEWVPVPYTPSVVFNTPMPGPANRRGGRGGARGGSQAGGRGPYNANASPVGGNDKDASVLSNGDVPKRGKSEGSVRTEQSPKARAGNNANGPSWKEGKASNFSAGKSLAENGGEYSEKKSVSGDLNTAQPASEGAHAPRSLANNRQKVNRKADGASGRKENDIISPARESSSNNHARRMSTATQTEGHEPSEKKASFNDGHGHGKSAPAERRGGPYGAFAGRDRDSRGRGGVRGGRGGHNAYANSISGQPFINGNGSVHAPSFHMPKSPTYFQEHSAGYFTPSRGGFGRNGSRSQSVSTDSMYGRMQNGFPQGNQNVPPIQTYMNGPYDYQMMQPMSAVPWSPYFGQDALFGMLTSQIEYYFSIENLCKDMFLRKRMDSKGFVFLSFIADFNRIKQITTDIELIKSVCYNSHQIEYRIGSDGKDRIRPLTGWEQWVVPMNERDVSAQTDGPEELQSPALPHPQNFAHSDPYQMMRYAGPLSAPGAPGAPHEHGFPPMNGLGINGTGEHGSYSRPNPEADSFSNEQVESLNVIVRKQDHAESKETSSHPGATRTFSNGSLDGRHATDEMLTLEARTDGPLVNGHVPAQGEGRLSSPDSKDSMSSEFDGKPGETNPVRLFWVKDKDSPVNQLPCESTCELYTHLRSKAFNQRLTAISGLCPHDMDVLYQFWSHFLIRNFNTGIYDEFRHLATEDLHERMSDTGMKNLIKYYAEALKSQCTIRQRVARHFVQLVQMESQDGERAAFTQLRLVWGDETLNPTNRKQIARFIDSDLSNALDGLG